MKYIVIMIFALGVSACGNTISGIGKDISAAGTNLTEWANTPSKKEETKESKK